MHKVKEIFFFFGFLRQGLALPLANLKLMVILTASNQPTRKTFLSEWVMATLNTVNVLWMLIFSFRAGCKHHEIITTLLSHGFFLGMRFERTHVLSFFLLYFCGCCMFWDKVSSFSKLASNWPCSRGRCGICPSHLQCAPPCLVYVLLETEPKASCMLGKNSFFWETSPVPSIIFFFKPVGKETLYF